MTAISFKQFLTEAVVKKWDKKALGVRQAIAYLNTHCKDGLKAISNGGVIYRGFGGASYGAGGNAGFKSDFIQLDSTNAVRTSRDSNNLYQLMMSASMHMQDIPSRGNSFICTTNYRTASEYYNPYVIIPHDGTTLAISMESDFISQYVNSILGRHAVSDLSGNIGCFLRLLGIMPDRQKQWTTISAIDEGLARIPVEDLIVASMVTLDPPMRDLAFGDIRSSMYKFNIASKLYAKVNAKDYTVLRSYVDSGKICKSLTALRTLFNDNPQHRFTALSSEIYSPEKLSIEVAQYGEKLEHNVECWFSGKCIAIDPVLFVRILVALADSEYHIHNSVIDEWENEMLSVKQAEETKRENEEFAKVPK